MSSSTLTYAAYGAVLAALALWAAVSARHDGWFDVGDARDALERNRVLRIVVVSAWAWLGWHLFARGSGAFDYPGAYELFGLQPSVAPTSIMTSRNTRNALSRTRAAT